MLSTPDGPFINLGRLNLSKYAQKNTLARSLFEYIFHHENDVRHVCTYLYSEKLCTIVLLTISLRISFQFHSYSMLMHSNDSGYKISYQK